LCVMLTEIHSFMAVLVPVALILVYIEKHNLLPNCFTAKYQYHTGFYTK